MWASRGADVGESRRRCGRVAAQMWASDRGSFGFRFRRVDGGRRRGGFRAAFLGITCSGGLHTSRRPPQRWPSACLQPTPRPPARRTVPPWIIAGSTVPRRPGRARAFASEAVRHETLVGRYPRHGPVARMLALRRSSVRAVLCVAMPCSVSRCALHAARQVPAALDRPMLSTVPHPCRACATRAPAAAPGAWHRHVPCPARRTARDAQHPRAR